MKKEKTIIKLFRERTIKNIKSHNVGDIFVKNNKICKKLNISKNDLILAELGDELITERICLEIEEEVTKKLLINADKELEKYKKKKNEIAIMDRSLYCIIAVTRLKFIEKRLNEIYKELKMKKLIYRGKCPNDK